MEWTVVLQVLALSFLSVVLTAVLAHVAWRRHRAPATLSTSQLWQPNGTDGFLPRHALPPLNVPAEALLAQLAELSAEALCSAIGSLPVLDVTALLAPTLSSLGSAHDSRAPPLPFPAGPAAHSLGAGELSCMAQ